ncbi:TetR/AcrR family transcriptional regulator [Chondromyces apiculatus]|uniref:Transcriptional regulator, TetR family n=1 Tax=Chondromyces apiculatus DSM 436 TaxID=1192034 RepID=A0A017T0Z5_9BACT|nr:TetR/AcrR family transcriptional regulator [Chondromyces apiculatus]EYF02652.1 Transcriptional regulator, TetR family [Chondromyces apiculatus DSM 436]
MCASPASDRVLHTAASLFYKRGIHAVGVDTVVSASAVAKMTLYKHFPSKDALVAAALDEQGTQWRAWFSAAVEAVAPTAPERILAIFDVLGHWFETEGFHGDATLNAAVELRGTEHPAWEVVRAHQGWLRGFIGGLVAEAGLDEPECTADALYLLMEGAIVGAQVGITAHPAAAARCAAGVLVEVRSVAHRPPREAGHGKARGQGQRQGQEQEEVGQ